MKKLEKYFYSGSKNWDSGFKNWDYSLIFVYLYKIPSKKIQSKGLEQGTKTGTDEFFAFHPGAP